jgi:hypothetical protein
MMGAGMKGVTSEVEDERRKQNAKWGDVDERRMPVGNDVPNPADRVDELFAKRAVERRSGTSLTWLDILREEFFEFAAEPNSNWPDQRRELVQVAAVAVAAIESGDLYAASQAGSGCDHPAT